VAKPTSHTVNTPDKLCGSGENCDGAGNPCFAQESGLIDDRMMSRSPAFWVASFLNTFQDQEYADLKAFAKRAIRVTVQ
jgi:hypothetical protein